MFHQTPSRPRKYNSNATILDVPIANQFCSSESAIEWLGWKELGKVVGESFGPSTAAGAIKYVDAAIVAACMLAFLSDHWYKASQMHRSASRALSVAKSSRWMCIRHHIRSPNLLVLASCQDGVGVQSSCSSVFGLE